MSARRWTGILFGVVFPCIFVLPSLVPGMVVLPLMSVWMLGRGLVRPEELLLWGVLLLPGLLCLVGLLGLFCLILFGVEPILKVPGLRLLVAISGGIGWLLGVFVCLGSFFSWLGLFFDPVWIDLFTWDRWMRFETWRLVFYEDSRSFLLGLVGPLLLGVRYLPQIFRSE